LGSGFRRARIDDDIAVIPSPQQQTPTKSKSSANPHRHIQTATQPMVDRTNTHPLTQHGTHEDRED
jgi:predicted glutamine amidotransferase